MSVATRARSGARALERLELPPPAAERFEPLPDEASRFHHLVGSDAAMREIFNLLSRVSATDATLLLSGETGTGKDVLARSVHAASKRKDGPFIAVDCGALVSSLIESELFGHEKGAFTGAAALREGAFELAHGGTLFLDEVGELPLDLQPKLLRALETRRIRRVGGTREVAVDLRVIAASNRNLPLEIERSKFRQDLYFRLAVVPVHVPPLRERRGDIPRLARELLVRLCREHGLSSVPELGPAADDALSAHDWPGNVRELRNVLERALLLSRGHRESAAHAGRLDIAATELGAGLLALSETRAAGPREPAGLPESFAPELSYRETKAYWEAEFERRYASWLLARHDGNVSAAARSAGMDRKHLYKLATRRGVRGGSGGVR